MIIIPFLTSEGPDYLSELQVAQCNLLCILLYDFYWEMGRPGGDRGGASVLVCTAHEGGQRVGQDAARSSPNLANRCALPGYLDVLQVQ